MRIPLAALAPTLVVGLLAAPAWSWWSQAVGPHLAPLPGVLGGLALLVGFRLLLTPLARASAWLAAPAGHRPDNR